MKLKRSFYRRNTKQVARELLGKVLVHRVGTKRLAGRITEVEAYIGVGDRACHAFGGRRTERVQSLYLDGGFAYVYFIYGMYYCLNVVTKRVGEPEAVLIRGVEPLEGIDLMWKSRPNVRKAQNLANGPGKLCKAFLMDKRLDRADLTGDVIFIEDRGDRIRNSQIKVSPRIGVAYAGPAAHWPLRFFL